MGKGTVPLSEDEQRRLDEIERALYRDDPKFAAGQSIERFRRRRMVMAGAAVLAGRRRPHLRRRPGHRHREVAARETTQLIAAARAPR